MNVWLEETTADVVLMQEVRANPKETQKALAPALEAGWHLVQAESAAKGRAGVGILSRTPQSAGLLPSPRGDECEGRSGCPAQGREQD